MNETIQQLQSRKSIRSFSDEHVKDEDLQTIFETALRAPTSVNGQQISLIYTKDKEKIKEISRLSGGQKQVECADVFVFFIIDFNRTSYAIESIGKEEYVDKTAEAIIVGSVDAGIMLSTLQTAAESLGYGTTAIGGIRNNTNKIIDLLGLPKKTYSVVGTTIGVATADAKNAPLKPRIPMESFVFEEVYDDAKVKEGVEEYERMLKAFREEHNMDYLTSYKEALVSYYGVKKSRETQNSFYRQGFLFVD
jgi:FMN reductase [NAD(P)H]